MAGLAGELSTSHRVYNVDLPGHGETLPLDGAPTFAAYAAELANFLDGHDLHDATLVGHSMGGVLSILAGGCSPRIAAVVNLDGALPLTPMAREIFRASSEKLDKSDFHPTMDALLRAFFFLPTEHGAEMEAIIADMLAMPEGLAKKLLAELSHVDGASALVNCRVPLLYVTGSRPLDDEPAIRALRPATTFARVEPSGHFLQVFALPQVAGEIRRFLASIPST
jgi:pimeloyl-ACP methyl ester carboxylesterase